MPHPIHGVIEDWQVPPLREMTPAERVLLGCDLIETGWQIAEAGRLHREKERAASEGV